MTVYEYSNFAFYDPNLTTQLNDIAKVSPFAQHLYLSTLSIRTIMSLQSGYA